MSLNQTPGGERLHIGFFGQRNAGKSSLVNAVTGQSLSVVSPVEGTTTDPVRKAMELLPLGPVLIIDTPGFNDEGELGRQRVDKTKEILDRADLAVLVIDASRGERPEDRQLEDLIRKKEIPMLKVFNKADLAKTPRKEGELWVCARTGEGIEELKNALGALGKSLPPKKKLLEGLVKPSDTVLLVIPIDESAPKGRLILPQQMTIRELLESGASVMACRDTELADTLTKTKRLPDLVICDSQAFAHVAATVPESVPLTSFSILFARYKGSLDALLKGASLLSELKDGDKVLISEGCTHHRQCNDIGSVKIPRLIRRFSGAEPEFSFTSGNEFVSDLSEYRLIIHCGGCMLNEKQMQSRLAQAARQGIPTVNYGIAIAHMNGVLRRSLLPFGKEAVEMIGEKA